MSEDIASNFARLARGAQREAFIRGYIQARTDLDTDYEGDIGERMEEQTERYYPSEIETK